MYIHIVIQGTWYFTTLGYFFCMKRCLLNNNYIHIPWYWHDTCQKHSNIIETMVPQIQYYRGTCKQNMVVP